MNHLTNGAGTAQTPPTNTCSLIHLYKSRYVPVIYMMCNMDIIENSGFLLKII